MFNPNKYETESEKLVYFKWTPQEIIVITKKEGWKYTASKVFLADPNNRYHVSFDLDEKSDLMEIFSTAESKLNSLYTTSSGMSFLSGLILSKALAYDFTQYDRIFQPEGNAKLIHVEVVGNRLSLAISTENLYFVSQVHSGYFTYVDVFTVKKFNGFLEKENEYGSCNKFYSYKNNSIVYMPLFYYDLKTLFNAFYQEKAKKDRINKAILLNRKYLESRAEKPVKKQKQEVIMCPWRNDPANIPENKNVVIAVFVDGDEIPAMYAGYRSDNKFYVAEYELDSDGCISEYEVNIAFGIFNNTPKILWMELPEFG